MKARGALLDINLHTITMMNNIQWFGADIGTYDILWMEEILHQLVDGLSHCNPTIYSVL